jgi:isopenicillin-N N-acyltransferase like protein
MNTLGRVSAMLMVVGSLLCGGQGASAAAIVRTFKLIELSGTPYQRGLQHGKLLHDSIHKAVEVWKENLRGTLHINPDLFIKNFARATNYVPSIEKWTPDLLQEVHGIAEGAGIDFQTMLVFQLPDEYWVNGSHVAEEHCSALGISATRDHSAFVAQNMDLEGFRDGFQTILHISEASGVQEFVLTFPGLIGFNGLNSKGVGITTNTLKQLANSRDGLPVAFVVRGVLSKRNFDEAQSFLKSVHHASGQNYTLGGGGRVAYFEASANKVVEVDPLNDGSFIFHTNHPVANEDYSPEGAQEMSHPNLADNTRTRYQALRNHLAGDPGKKVIDLIQGTLRSHDSQQYPVCRPLHDNFTGFTYASTIMVLEEQPYLIAAPGTPDQHNYTVFRFAAERKPAGFSR